MSNLDGLTQLEVETIQYNLNAFDVTFQPLMIIKKNKQFFVFQNDMSKYVYVTRSIQNLNGWLYGAIQAKNGVIR